MLQKQGYLKVNPFPFYENRRGARTLEKEYLKSTTQNYSKSGIDTVRIIYKYKSDLDIEVIKALGGVIDKYTYFPNREEVALVIKASECINGGIELTNLNDTMEIVKGLELELSISLGKLTRVDFSFDTSEKLEENKRKYRLFLECLDLKRRSGGVYETKKPIKEERRTGNLKTSTKRQQTTVYNCEDKPRYAKIRLENRIEDIRLNESVEQVIKIELKKYIKELHKLEELVPMVEVFYINYLVEEYRRTIKKEFRTFTEFITWADKEQLILTERILKEVLKASGTKTRFKYFLDNFRKLRPCTLKFTNKSELKKVIILVKKELKKIT